MTDMVPEPYDKELCYHELSQVKCERYVDKFEYFALVLINTFSSGSNTAPSTVRALDSAKMGSASNHRRASTTF
jgi:hypothetical protein